MDNAHPGSEVGTRQGCSAHARGGAESYPAGTRSVRVTRAVGQGTVGLKQDQGTKCWLFLSRFTAGCSVKQIGVSDSK